MAEAAAFGDLKENAAYHDARDKMAFLRMRIKELEGAINEAVVKEGGETGKVQIGSKVAILFAGQKEEYMIVSSSEADALKNKISYQSPLGEKLVGRKVGDKFDFGAKKVKIEILKIE